MGLGLGRVIVAELKSGSKVTTAQKIWIDALRAGLPEESRRKNHERTDPNDPGSILHHGVPMAVMLGDYGCDDMEWLIRQSDRPDTVRVETRGSVYHLPVARFDNRVDKTTFVRAERGAWKPADVAALHAGLAEAFGRLARAGAARVG